MSYDFKIREKNARVGPRPKILKLCGMCPRGIRSSLEQVETLCSRFELTPQTPPCFLNVRRRGVERIKTMPCNAIRCPVFCFSDRLAVTLPARAQGPSESTTGASP